MPSTEEELSVLFYASQLGRSDIVREAIATLKTILDDNEAVSNLISSCSEYKVDENTTEIGTPLHVATSHGHSDVVRALLVSTD